MTDDALNLTAVEEFRSARWQASLEKIHATLTGKSAELLSYDDVREKLHVHESNRRELKEIPLDAIVGSVGRYMDFTRRFFPRQEQDELRWARVRTQVESMEGLPPIEAYQLGDVYFIIDGNHRTSVARSIGATSIEGYVTQVHAPVPLSPDANPDALIIAERYARFLEKTELTGAYPEINLRMSAAGNYRVLEQRIWVHQQWMGAETTFPHAAAHWYKTVYWPVIQIIRRRGMLRDFPQRTETDLYVWIEKHQRTVAEHLGWSLDPRVAAVELVDTFSQKPVKILKRAREKLLDALTPDAVEAGPMPGEWREIWESTHQDRRLFRHILVAVDGTSGGWHALEQALEFGKQEQSRVYGLHIVHDAAAKQTPQVDEIRKKFQHYGQQAEVQTQLRVEDGNIQRHICDSARWMDLVVVSVAHPPRHSPLDRLGSGLSQLLRRCPRPVLTVPKDAHPIERLLLAYDDSPKSKEALFVAAYLAKHWNMTLTVFSMLENDGGQTPIQHARQYLEKRNIAADYFEKKGKAASIIIDTLMKQPNNLVIMGGYGLNPILEIVFGSTVDEILRARVGPVLICR
ncbi:MAG: universal stress protein [Chloroflexi bacterium]|nr:universal stress protein [Chloroflexota bacterium]